MSKQTAVEWLIEEIDKHLIAKSMGRIYDQAKAMDREQKEAAYNVGATDGFSEGLHLDNPENSSVMYVDGKDYFNKTYGGNNEQG